MLRGVLAILFGPLFIIGSSVLLFWNEGRAVQTAHSLAEGRDLVIGVLTSSVDGTNEGKLIHVSGDVEAKLPLRDPQFTVSASGLKLVRNVEMYQWKEQSANRSSGDAHDSYDYVRVWNGSRIDSSHFRRKEGHENPEMRFTKASFTASDAALGAFHLGERALTLLPTSQPIKVSSAMVEGLRGRISGSVQEFDGKLYLGADPAAPRIGDIRISFGLAPNGAVSFIGRQSGADVTEYQTKSGDRLLIARSGIVSAGDMFSTAEHKNRVLSWMLRVAGILAMFFGFVFLLAPLGSILNFVPFVGGLVAAAAALVAAMLTALAAPLIVAIAWFWFRPIVSILVLLVGVAVAFALRAIAARKVATHAAPQTAT